MVKQTRACWFKDSKNKNLWTRGDFHQWGLETAEPQSPYSIGIVERTDGDKSGQMVTVQVEWITFGSIPPGPHA